MEEKHKILFSKGILYFDGEPIAGKGIAPDKDVLFEFAVKDEVIHKKVETSVKEKDPSILEVNVVDEVRSKDVGPGQRG